MGKDTETIDELKAQLKAENTKDHLAELLARHMWDNKRLSKINRTRSIENVALKKTLDFFVEHGVLLSGDVETVQAIIGEGLRKNEGV